MHETIILDEDDILDLTGGDSEEEIKPYEKSISTSKEYVFDLTGEDDEGECKSDQRTHTSESKKSLDIKEKDNNAECKSNQKVQTPKKEKKLDLIAEVGNKEFKACKKSPNHKKKKSLDSGNESDCNMEVKEEFNTSSPHKKKSSGAQSNSDKRLKNCDKSLDMALEEIKKGGSLAKVAVQYGISEGVLYQKIVSRSLPNEMDILTTYEEKNLVDWILNSNKKNTLVFKENLMEKVGKMKKVCKITPIFSKSKFGKKWYFYFMSAHPEIYDNDGVLLPCEVINYNYVKRSNNSMDEQEIKSENESEEEKPLIMKQDMRQLLLSFGIKNAVVVLHDFRKEKNSPCNIIKKENIPCQTNEDESGESSTVEPNIVEHTINDFPEVKVDSPKASNGSYGNKQIERHISNILQSNFKRGGKPTCKKCNRSFCNKSKLKRHLYLHVPKELHKIACFKCLKRFPSTYHFKQHIRISHNNRFFKCNDCDRVYKHSTSLTKHKKVHRGIVMKKSRFTCDLCEKSFTYKNSLEAHILYHHLKEEKKFSCSVCKLTFDKRSRMMRHKMRHTKKKPFICLHCGKSFSRKYILRQHIEMFCKEEENITTECKQISQEYLADLTLDSS